MKNIVLIIILVVAGYFIWNYAQQDSMMMAPKSSSQGEEMTSQNESNESEMAQSNENEVSGTAGYTAQKVYFGQPAQTVVGETSGVSGTLIYADGILNAEVNVSTENLSTDSNMRDNDVRDLIGQTIQAEISNAEVTLPFTQELFVALTINGVTNDVPFELTGAEIDEALTLSGTGTILMSDFGIDAPGNPNIYSVEDEIILSVNLVTEA